MIFFDLWVHMMVELWFYPYKLIGGQNAVQSNIHK